MAKRQILLTNDDGIRSPGLWAAAQALSALGFVTVVAPRDQASGMGRSLPSTSDGIITVQTVRVGEQDWTVHSVGGSPAQAVQHGLIEIMPHRPDLVVSGINYGENVGSGVTISGTVGAAMEAAALGVPALAISLETEQEHHMSYSLDVDFNAAASFAVTFGRLLLERHFPVEVDLLKVDVPRSATPDTPWQVTRLSRQRYFEPVPPSRTDWSQPGRVGYREAADLVHEPADSDVFMLRKLQRVSVTPLSLDMTARVDLQAFEALLREG